MPRDSFAGIHSRFSCHPHARCGTNNKRCFDKIAWIQAVIKEGIRHNIENIFDFFHLADEKSSIWKWWKGAEQHILDRKKKLDDELEAAESRAEFGGASENFEWNEMEVHRFKELTNGQVQPEALIVQDPALFANQWTKLLASRSLTFSMFHFIYTIFRKLFVEFSETQKVTWQSIPDLLPPLLAARGRQSTVAQWSKAAKEIHEYIQRREQDEMKIQRSAFLRSKAVGIKERDSLKDAITIYERDIFFYDLQIFDNMLTAFPAILVDFIEQCPRELARKARQTAESRRIVKRPMTLGEEKERNLLDEIIQAECKKEKATYDECINNPLNTAAARTGFRSLFIRPDEKDEKQYFLPLLTDLPKKLDRLEHCGNLDLSTMSPVLDYSDLANFSYLTSPAHDIFDMPREGHAAPFCWTKKSFLQDIVIPFMGKRKSFEHKPNHLFVDWDRFDVKRDLEERQKEVDRSNQRLEDKTTNLEDATRNGITEQRNYLLDSFPKTIMPPVATGSPVPPETIQHFFTEYKRKDLSVQQYNRLIDIMKTLLVTHSHDRPITEQDLKWNPFVDSLSDEIKSSPQFEALDRMIHYFLLRYSPASMGERRAALTQWRKASNSKGNLNHFLKTLPSLRSLAANEPAQEFFRGMNADSSFITSLAMNSLSDEEKAFVNLLPTHTREQLRKLSLDSENAKTNEAKYLALLESKWCVNPTDASASAIHLWNSVAKFFLYFLFDVGGAHFEALEKTPKLCASGELLPKK